jgi:CCR4-NOT transcription complex subunit 6
VVVMFDDGHVSSLLASHSLTVESLLEFLDEESLRKDMALPSSEWPSNHIALLVEFRCKPRTR